MENNEIILAGNTTLGKTKLGRTTTKVITLINSQIRDEKQIAVSIAEVDREDDATKAGFKNTAEWAEKFFGFSKSKVSRYISITARFKWTKVTDETGADYWDIFTLSQMQEMLKATDEQIKHITPDMTVKEIREYLSYVDITDGAEDTDGAEGTNDAEDTEDENPAEETENDVIEREFDDITCALSYIKKILLSKDGAGVGAIRMGNTFKVVTR